MTPDHHGNWTTQKSVQGPEAQSDSTWRLCRPTGRLPQTLGLPAPGYTCLTSALHHTKPSSIHPAVLSSNLSSSETSSQTPSFIQTEPPLSHCRPSSLPSKDFSQLVQRHYLVLNLMRPKTPWKQAMESPLSWVQTQCPTKCLGYNRHSNIWAKWNEYRIIKSASQNTSILERGMGVQMRERGALVTEKYLPHNEQVESCLKK